MDKNTNDILDALDFIKERLVTNEPLPVRWTPT